MKRLSAFLLCALLLCSAVFAEEAEALPAEPVPAEAEAAPEEQDPQKLLLSFYDGSLFVGDSIMNGLRRYRSERNEEEPDFLKNIEIVSTGSIGLYQASLNRLSDDNNLRYKGRELTLYQIVERAQPRKLFILLGLNDPVAIKIDKAMTWAARIIRTVRERSPETEIYFFSNTPVTPRYCSKKKRSDYPALVDEYNRRLQALCEEQGAVYFDIATALKDEQGYLKDELSSDKYVHLSNEGVEVWLGVLCDYARAQWEAGLWEPVSTAGEETPSPEETAPAEEGTAESGEPAAREGEL